VQTRCAELALFVCRESPVINARDHPNHYKDQPGLDFLKIVPTIWDDTRALDAAVGEHVVIARRSGNRWFLGALTDRIARDIPVKLDFLGGGSWKLKLWIDAPDSDTEGEHLVVEERTQLRRTSVAPAHAGGAVACFEPVSALKVAQPGSMNSGFASFDRRRAGKSTTLNLVSDRWPIPLRCGRSRPRWSTNDSCFSVKDLTIVQFQDR
jgi:hypothetical protein